MCGIAGIINSTAQSPERLRNLATKMATAINHRGPDGDGIWTDADNRVALAHKRLSIVDLTPSGAQPMISHCGNYIMVYNGEVYNATEIAAELRKTGTIFRGTSDTEVILGAIAQWGLNETIEKLIGMFSLALWDIRTKTLTLVRDRLGIKPLYWSFVNDTFIFASELKALLHHPVCPREVNKGAISSYLQKCYINGPDSIYCGVHKLLPGHLLTLVSGKSPKIREFWSMSNVAKSGTDNQFDGSIEEAEAHLEALVKSATSMRMLSDVPLGAFLSGGVDSSLVAALMQHESSKPIKTFSIGFEDSQFNEAPHAAEVAKHLGTDHTELYVTPQNAMDVIPNLHTIFDEPFSDPSQIPTYLLCKMTRQHVTVALSGDGGDELFTGYERYFTVNNNSAILKQPRIIRNTGARILNSISPVWANRMRTILPGRVSHLLAGHKIHRIPPALRDGQLATLYQSTLAHYSQPNNLMLSDEEIDDPVYQQAQSIKFKDSFSLMQFIDTLDYLPGDILTKLDRTSMATSLEARVPLLDHRIVEFAWTLPQIYKAGNGEGKRILKNVLYKHVPRNLIERPKMGFGVPIGQWLRGPLNSWAEDLLSHDSLKSTGILDPNIIRKHWNQHKKHQVNWEYHLWDVLNLQSWAINNSI
ncbi:asparagine synthase (glutamine-hydrolyzing) [Chromatiales bacterium (ex Bugula neritina AB1)]|nr:asparagine synthase (glutamine-hydrolyzing) [Chromatiales bacterium (ex Bugula neritina AB1)]